MPAGRFAPSPTGPLHVGNLRTAVLAWLFARSDGSRFLIRVEDLDPVASQEVWVEGHLADLAALGISSDEPVARQSAPSLRARHQSALDRLTAAGLTYPCFCTRREVAAAARAPHEHLPEGAYPGTCRDLTAAEVERRRAEGRPASLRVRAGAAVVEVIDRVHGLVLGAVDDFVVQRADGVPAYNLAVVVDDDAQAIGEVVRGDDLLPGTPRQVWLAATLGLAVPAYAHVPLVLGPDGQRLAKRHGAVTLTDLASSGVGVDRLLGWMGASLGLAAPRERVDLAVLLERFDPDEVATVPATFDPAEVAVS